MPADFLCCIFPFIYIQKNEKRERFAIHLVEKMRHALL